MAKLFVLVRKGRRTCGRALLLARDGRTLLGPFRILATASRRVACKHGNAKRSPLLPFGHPPSGTYVIIASLPPSTPHRRADRHGRLGARLLAPRGGDALVATANGRMRYTIHGGPQDRAGRLRPTFGGLRLSDPDLSALIDAINRAFRAGDPVSSVEIIEEAESATDAGFAALPFSSGSGVAATSETNATRRRFLHAAVALSAALAMAACGGTPDRPSPTPPRDCTPIELPDGGLDPVCEAPVGFGTTAGGSAAVGDDGTVVDGTTDDPSGGYDTGGGVG
jgi:hypothetical protein